MSADATGALSTSLVLSQSSTQSPSAGIAAFQSLLVQGVVGLTYSLNVTCASSSAALPAIMANVTIAPCPPGTQVAADLRQCMPCKLGSEFNLKAGGVCKPCPMGAFCPEPDKLLSQPHWWCA